jgi:lipid A 3-O-deacylase
MRGRIGWAALGIGVAAAVLLICPIAKAENLGLISVGAGAFDFDHDRTTAAEGRVEYRFAQSFFFLKPLIGTYFTQRGSVYTYGGFRVELPIGKHILVVPMAAVGDYEKGDGKDLGSHVEFKTGVEVDWVFDNGVRIGPVFDHVSNAGLTRKNPGEENLLLMVSMPLDVIIGRR